MSFQPIGRAFALVQPTYERQPLKTDLIKPSEDQGEVIKVGVSLNFNYGSCTFGSLTSNVKL